MKKTNLLVTLTLFLLVVSAPVTAQRIGIGEGTSPENQQNDTKATGAEKADPDTRVSGRIIPPEDFGKYRRTDSQESELSKAALIEKLRADSAAMSIRHEEAIRQLRSDSEAMRKTIENLRQRIATLKSRDSEETASRSPKLKRSDRASTGMSPRRTSDAAEDSSRDTQSDTQKASESEPEETTGESRRDEDSTISSDRRLNPNTASLSDLKSIPNLSDRLAERIEWYRREVTPFEDLQDLKRVPGIDRQTFESIRDYFHEGPY